ncbi:unnamed protein product [Ostreobium quekettii]|uniref:Uncharacterized protein n=1 Tax=Ostreobium quekettii TaxID=121088 RepID=A0A8S1IQ27_9CHLO|nr:unnamed protein product [Ostreobium quekettii]CAD7696578.1 unnamed protein product [Ostreobium quekettii]
MATAPIAIEHCLKRTQPNGPDCSLSGGRLCVCICCQEIASPQTPSRFLARTVGALGLVAVWCMASPSWVDVQVGVGDDLAQSYDGVFPCHNISVSDTAPADLWHFNECFEFMDASQKCGGVHHYAAQFVACLRLSVFCSQPPLCRITST